ncbi:MAG: T9SS type A sorting domain-containing protein [Bacteroidota bacterium]
MQSKTFWILLIAVLCLEVNAQNCDIGDIGTNEDFPYITIPVVFHSITNSSGDNLNCIPGSPYNITTVMQPVVDYANERLANPRVNEFGNAGRVPDTYLRFTETLTCDNFRFYPQGGTAVFVEDAFNIILLDTNSPFTGGRQIGPSSIEIYNIVKFVTDGSYNLYAYGRLLLHEFGHSLSLCHSFSEQNRCKGIDMDPAEECGPPTCTQTGNGRNCPPANPNLGLASCGGATDLCCYCTRNRGNNMMGYGDQNALTPCQHELMMTDLLIDNPRAYLCNGVPELDIEKIFSGQRVEWNTVQIKNHDIEIQSGASLKISCNVLMGPGKRITVQRGAKLILAGGTIRDLCGEDWAGIFVEGNGNINQPDASVINDDLYALPASNEAGIFYGTGGFVRGAQVSISTKSWEDRANRNFWGGIIYCVGVNFINNNRAIEFTRYSRPNQSKFINCTFQDDFGRVGVTILGCKGLEFRGNRFIGLEQGIEGLDFGATIKSANRFEECQRAIEVHSSGIFETEVIVGEDNSTVSIPRNVFISPETEGSIGVYGGSPTGARGLVVVDNLFQNYPTDVLIQNDGKYTIAKNVFEHVDEEENNDVGVEVNFTGQQFNRIFCNIFINKGFGINALSRNDGLLFQGNRFDSYVTDVTRALGLGGINTSSVAMEQGSSTQPANNCFTPKSENALVNHIIRASGRVRPIFNYHFTQEIPGDNCVTDPDQRNILDGYRKKETAFLYEPCAKEINGFRKIFQKEDLEDAYATLEDVEQNLIEQPQDPTLLEELEVAKTMKNNILTNLVFALHPENTADRDELLMNDPSYYAKKLNFSVHLSDEDYTTAQQLLNQLPRETSDQEDFYQVQSVNLDSRQAERFELSAVQSATLHTIANNDLSSSRSNARGLLITFEGAKFTYDSHRFYPASASVERSSNGSSNQLSEPRVQPNPNKGNFSVELPVDYVTEGEIMIYDLHGRVIANRTISPDRSSASYKFDQMQAGVYILQVREQNNLKYVQKVTIID